MAGRKMTVGLCIMLILLVMNAALIPVLHELTGGAANTVYDENLITYDGWDTPTGGPHPVKLPAYIRPDSRGTVVIRNRLMHSLGDGTCLAFRSEDAYVTVSVEDQVVYTGPKALGPTGEKPLSMWHFVRLEPDFAGRGITITFNGPDRLKTGSVSEVLLGTYAEVLMYATTCTAFEQRLSAAVMLIGVLVFLFSLITFTNSRSSADFILLGVFISLLGLACTLRTPVPRGSSYGYFTSEYVGRSLTLLLPPLYCLYRGRRVTGQVTRGYSLVFRISLCCTAIVTALYLAGPAALWPVLRLVSYAVFELVFLFCFYRTLYREGAESRRYRVLAAAGSAALILGTGVDAFTPLGVTAFSRCSLTVLGALLFSFLQSVAGILSAFEYVEKRLSLEREMNRDRIRLMISQIRPHFISNVMTTIRAMIRYDPDQAYEMAYDFNNYLTYNLDALSSTEVCPFSQELRHIRTYISIEQPRLMPRLRVKYEIETEDFEVPPLSIQPFVENAVKHGVAPKEGPGTIVIATEETEEAYIVHIEDDGVGFDSAVPADTTAGHGIGVQNATQRLRLQVDGTVEIRSTPGEGTAVRITIPKLSLEDLDENDIG